jgi:hypothetical protein
MSTLPPTPSPFGRTWSAEIAARCAAQNRPPAVASAAAILGALLDNGLVDLPTAGLIARGEADPAALDGYLVALSADVWLATREGGAL